MWLWSRFRAAALAVVSGVTLHFAFPPWNYEVLAWVWLLPVLALLWPLRAGAVGLRRPFGTGYLAGLAFFLPDVAWVRHSARVIHGALDHEWIGWGPELLGLAAMTGLAGFLALYFGLWTWFVARFASPRAGRLSGGTAAESTIESLRCAGLAAAAWVGCEWLRGWVLTGFGWNGLGVALHRNTALIQIADVVGVAGLAFLPVFLACTGWMNVIRLARHWRGESVVRTRLDFTLAMVVLLGVAVYGMMRIRGHDEGPALEVRALLVQPNVPQVVRWDPEKDLMSFYQRLHERTLLYAEARNGEASAMDLVVWPENAIPVTLDQDADSVRFHREFFDEVLGSGDFALLTGVGTRAEGEDQYHNSAILFDGGYENQQRAHKMHLVPFGEYLPFRRELGFMETLFGNILPGDFQPGRSHEPLRMTLKGGEGVELIPLICFEDTVGRFARRFVRPGPQILANVTNDGWFLQSRETEVHLANSIFRAVELRRPMLRAANTGVSGFIDPLGRVTSRLEDPETGTSFIEGCLPGVMRVPMEGEMTFYARFGDVFALGCLAVCAGVALVRGGCCRRRAQGGRSSS
jgi:apolipoprotein N-acyltransferase